MSLHPQPLGPVPEQTARIASLAFPQGSAYLRLRDELGSLFEDAAFAPLFPSRGQPAEAPWRLALVTLLQYAENLSDREAAHAVRSRLDWKYLLGLELQDPGFDFSVLSEFRTRLVAGGAETLLLDAVLERCRQKGLLSARRVQRSDSTHVLAKVRALNRLELAGETLRAALNTLAVAHPQWLHQHVQPQWAARYGERLEEAHLPRSEAERTRLAEEIGRDGFVLLEALAQAEALVGLRLLPAVEGLRQVWLQQFYREEWPEPQGEPRQRLRWRRDKEEGLPPAAQRLLSPYDREARAAKKRSTLWSGYKVHLTETCEEDQPRLITQVQTTPAPQADGACTEPIHQGLEQKDLLPSQHLVDASYVSAELLLQSQERYGVDLFGPTVRDQHWQSRSPGTFAAPQFTLDWQGQQAFCPAGKASRAWREEVDHRQREVIKIRFSPADCGRCAQRPQCTRAKQRSLTLRPQAQHQTLQAARQREATVQFAEQYAQRAGIEGTLSQGVRAMGLRRCRYIGERKTHLQHVGTAAAINLVRLAAWFAGETPAQTRHSAFRRLMDAPVPS